MGKIKNIKNHRFGMLVAIEVVASKRANTLWKLRCDCGQETTGLLHNLQRGRKKSCGCSRYPLPKERLFMNGYSFVVRPEHPRASKRTGRVREHILVMEGVLGRPLFPLEEVHHKNGNRSDNRPENLELWSRSHPAGTRVEDLVRWAREILAMYRMTP